MRGARLRGATGAAYDRGRRSFAAATRFVMPAARRTSLAAHYLRYASANLLVLAAGLVSFPITTRLLSNAEFGILSYWDTALLFVVALLKLGAGEAMMRFYPHGGDPRTVARYNANLVVFPALLTLAGWLVVMGVFGSLALAGQLEAPMLALLAMAQALPGAWGALALRVYQSRERSGAYSVAQVAWRWAVVAGTLLALLYWMPSAAGALGGRLVANVIVVAALVALLLHGLRFGRQDFDRGYAMEGLRFGLPVALMEINYVAMWSIDRMMLKWLLDDFGELGIYSIGMALASYIDQLLSTALNQAVGPVINRVYATEGAEGVRRMKAQLLRPLVYLSAALGAGLVMAGHDLLAIVASSSKSASAPIFVIMGCVFLLRPLLSTSSEGLLLQKRSRIVSALTIGAAVCSVLLNLLLIPRYGIYGSAATSCLCVVGLQLAYYAFCPRELRARPSWRVVGLALVLASSTVALAWETNLFGASHPLARVGCAAVLVVAGCVLPVFVFDRRMREMLAQRVAALRQRTRAA